MCKQLNDSMLVVQPDQQARAADPRSRGSQQRDNQAYEYEEGRAYELPPPAAQAGRYADWAGRDDSVRWRDDSAWQPASARQEAEQVMPGLQSGSRASA